MSFDAIANVSFKAEEVIVAVSPGRFGGHLGIGFHAAKEGAQLLHLRWHKDLAVESTSALSACWIACKPELPPLAAKAFVGMLRAVAKRRPEINYAANVILAKGSFDQNGRYSPPKGSPGLTCATFVTELFRAARLPLVRENTWQPSKENIAWANEVISLLEEKKVDEAHVNAVRKAVDGLRVRPEEVGAAAVVPLKQRPVSYEVAYAGAVGVMAKLNDVCPPRRSAPIILRFPM